MSISPQIRFSPHLRNHKNLSHFSQRGPRAVDLIASWSLFWKFVFWPLVATGCTCGRSQAEGWTKKKDKCASTWKQRTQQPDLKFVTKNHTQFGHLKNWGEGHLSFWRSIIFKTQPDMISIGILSEFVKLRVFKFINKKAEVHQVLVNYKTTFHFATTCVVFFWTNTILAKAWQEIGASVLRPLLTDHLVVLSLVGLAG